MHRDPAVGQPLRRLHGQPPLGTPTRERRLRVHKGGPRRWPLRSTHAAHAAFQRGHIWNRDAKRRGEVIRYGRMSPAIMNNTPHSITYRCVRLARKQAGETILPAKCFYALVSWLLVATAPSTAIAAFEERQFTRLSWT